VKDGFGMGTAVPSASGAPSLALSIAAHASVVSESTIEDWKRVFLQEMSDRS